MIPILVLEYVAELFAAGWRGRGVTLGDDGMPHLWLFGEQNAIPWWDGHP